MKNLLILLLAIAMPWAMSAQDDEPDYGMVEHVHIKVKPDMNEKFEAAVKAHNANYHSGAHSAGLMSYAVGSDVGTYIWSMGPCTMTDLDSRPDDDAHNDDWENNVEPLIESVEGVYYWTLGRDVSVMAEADDMGDAKMYGIWMLEIADGEWDEFNDFMEDVKTVYEKVGDETITVWYNRFNEGDGKDVAIVWPMQGWADFDDESWSMDEEYDKEFGEGEWENALDDWDDAVESVYRTVWYIHD